MPNYNKAIINGTTYIDLSSDTVASDKLLDGYTAHDKNGAVITGTIATVAAGTPTATKGSVYNNKVDVTPSVTNTTGYITGSTINGTAVTVTARELVSGCTLIADDAGDWDVANCEILTIPQGSATPASSISGTSATVSAGNNTITLSKTISNTPQVSGGYVYSGTSGNSNVSLTASVTTKAAATITPGTTNQTIASGTYLTGTQTIAGDADLVASNIVSGVQIFGVTGNVVLQNYYTGSSAPSSSLGSNGDIYLQT